MSVNYEEMHIIANFIEFNIEKYWIKTSSYRNIVRHSFRKTTKQERLLRLLALQDYSFTTGTIVS